MSSAEDRVAALMRWREKIDALNLQLLALLEARGRAVEAIMDLKQGLGVESHDPDREKALLAMMESHASGPYSREQVGRVFLAIFEGLAGARMELPPPGRRLRSLLLDAARPPA